MLDMNRSNSTCTEQHHPGPYEHRSPRAAVSIADFWSQISLIAELLPSRGRAGSRPACAARSCGVYGARDRGRRRSLRMSGVEQVACFPPLDKQGFAGNPLDRSILSGQGCTSNTHADLEQLETTRFMVVCGSKVFGEKSEESFSLLWLPRSALLESGLLPDASTHLLGASEAGARFAASTTAVELTTSAMQALYPGAVGMDLRALLMAASRADAAIAGHAVALTRWHTVRPHGFSNRHQGQIQKGACRYGVSRVQGFLV